MATPEISQSYERWKTAVMQGDLESLSEICSENFLWTNNMGITYNKVEKLNKICSGTVQYISWITQNMVIDTMDDVTCIVKSRDTCKLVVYGIKVTAIQDLTTVFIRENENWRVARVHETAVN